MTPNQAEQAVRDTARLVAAEACDVLELRSALLNNLRDLCSERPLQGDFLLLFDALERWEAATTSLARADTLSEVRSLAHRLGSY